MASGKLNKLNTPTSISTLAELQDITSRHNGEPVMLKLDNDLEAQLAMCSNSGANCFCVAKKRSNDANIDVVSFAVARTEHHVYNPSSGTNSDNLFIPNNYLIKTTTHTCSYKCTTAKQQKSLLLSDFTPAFEYFTNFIPIGVSEVTSGSIHNQIYYYRCDFSEEDITNKTASVISLKNDGSANSDNVTASITIVYLRTAP